MLQLNRICKQYRTGDFATLALDNVSLNLRDSEFVAILGPSGSGKTTLLNIIGGLDRYDAGDLVINGISTRSYRDRDWDSYRNHTVGFVFQSYNLIPHQTVLANVELALTISGASKRERRERALRALDQVGLSEHVRKRPNQLSGGQMQRVAIARALVNNPSILLADEPTGALDTETSIQVMELLRAVASDRLVVMVTHNPELAERYATRTVRLRDGRIVRDSNPFVPAPAGDRVPQIRPPKVGMGFATSMGLSSKNLMTKAGRTILTSFAGSIGIIGIALIMAMSSSVNGYVNDVQRDTMVSYPITIQSETIDLSAMMSAQMQEARDDGRGNEAPSGASVSYDGMKTASALDAAVVHNDLRGFKAYLDDDTSEIHDHVGKNGIVYGYETPFDVYAYDGNGVPIDTSADPGSASDPISAGGTSAAGGGIRPAYALASEAAEAENFGEIPMLPDGRTPNQSITDNYEVVAGRWPVARDEVIAVTSADGGIEARVACQIGLLSKKDYDDAKKTIDDGGDPRPRDIPFDEIMGLRLTLLARCDQYELRERGRFEHVTSDGTVAKGLLESKGVPLRVVGVARMRPEANGSSLPAALPSFAYPPSLTDMLVERSRASEVVVAQAASPTHSVITGLRFGLVDEAQKAEAAKAYVASLPTEEKAQLYVALSYMNPGAFPSPEPSPQADATMVTDPLTGETVAADPMAGMMAMSAMSGDEAMADALNDWLVNSPDQGILASLYDRYSEDATLDSTMREIGMTDADSPSSISIYADSFEDKDAITECISEYNEAQEDEGRRIEYTDYVALITGSVTSIINIISYVLIAFVAVSLVVSSIMIGIITHISVMERTKEIGILRALGASRRNISQVFTAETVIIGLLSGLIGVGVSALLTIPITAVIRAAMDAGDMTVSLPPSAAAILVGISVAVTVIGGIAPSRKASWQDPVIALRTE